MIDRYQRPWVKAVFSDEARFRRYLEVEIAVLETYEALGMIPREDVKKLKANVAVDVEDILAQEAVLKHDVIAFTRSVTRQCGPEKAWFHYGLTSTDVVDTAWGLAYQEVNGQLLNQWAAFLQVLKRKARQYKHTPMIGRTHGIHADVTTLGLKFALWYDTAQRHLQIFLQAAKVIEVGKISGAVGQYAQTPPIIEAGVSQRLGLTMAPISTQIINRDRHAHYLHALMLMASGIEQIALEIRHLQRTEVGELKEPFAATQKGSSAMPHKQNPIVSENITGLARLMRSYTQAANENIALWHERDISHSSVERVIIPDAVAVFDTMLSKMQAVLENIVVDEQAMQRNLHLTQGVIFAQAVMHALVDQGWTREDAYDAIQPLSLQAYQTQQPLRTLLENDPKIHSHLSAQDLDRCFDVHHRLQYVDTIFERLQL